MAAVLLEDVDVIEIVGVVTPPPNLDTILQKLADAAEGKQTLQLTAGEARVLHDFIEAF